MAAEAEAAAAAAVASLGGKVAVMCVIRSSSADMAVVIRCSAASAPPSRVWRCCPDKVGDSTEGVTYEAAADTSG